MTLNIQYIVRYLLSFLFHIQKTYMLYFFVPTSVLNMADCDSSYVTPTILKGNSKKNSVS